MSDIESAMLKILGKVENEPMHIDMHAKHMELGLAHLVPDSVWPPTNAVRKLGAKSRAIKKSGPPHPFLCAERRK